MRSETGATSATFFISATSTANAGSYACLVSNSAGSVLSASAKVDVVATVDARRVVNIATRGLVSTGDNILIAGFVIGGTTSKTVLLRASGPALRQFLPTGTLPDPVLRVYNSSSAVLASRMARSRDRRPGAARLLVVCDDEACSVMSALSL